MSPSLPDGPEWIAVDWGTSRLRAWAVGAGGVVLANAASDRGMASLDPSRFEDALLELVGPWLADGEKIEVVICGMAGARQGWKESPYREIPCAPVRSNAGIAVDTRDPRLAVSIVPGLSQSDPPDVMRGEETQLAGLLAARPGFDGMVCLPGTHSKWVELAGGHVTHFGTFMTGELFGLLAGRSILRRTVPDKGWDESDFIAAVREAADDPLSVNGKLFALRAGPLLGTPPAGNLRARLSGLLIGAEMAAVRDSLTGDGVVVIGDGVVAGSYAIALGTLGYRVDLHDAATLTLAGLAAARGGQGDRPA